MKGLIDALFLFNFTSVFAQNCMNKVFEKLLLALIVVHGCKFAKSKRNGNITVLKQAGRLINFLGSNNFFTGRN